MLQTPAPILTTDEIGPSPMADAIDAASRGLALPRPAALATLDDALSPADIAATLRFAAASKAANTKLAYAADWADFVAWCGERGAQPLPCPPGLLCGYLSALATRGLRASTIRRRASGIAAIHRQAGHEMPPTNSEAVKQVLRGIRRSLGVAPVKKAPATAELVRAMMDACPSTLIGLRDRALFAVGLAGAFRRSELLALQVEDLTWVAEGLRIRIARSKTDQEGRGQSVAIPHGARIRPVEALREWLDAAGITDGPVFRAVSKGGTVAATPLSGDGYVRAIKRRAAAAGFDPAELAGHSLRSGFMTSAAGGGASLAKMMEVSRHRSVDVAMGYVRDRDAWRDHAGASFL